MDVGGRVFSGSIRGAGKGGGSYKPPLREEELKGGLMWQSTFTRVVSGPVMAKKSQCNSLVLQSGPTAVSYATPTS